MSRKDGGMYFMLKVYFANVNAIILLELYVISDRYYFNYH